VNYRTMTGCVVDYGGTAFVVQPWPFTLIFCAPELPATGGETPAALRESHRVNTPVCPHAQALRVPPVSSTNSVTGVGAGDGERGGLTEPDTGNNEGRVYEGREPLVSTVADTVVRVEAVYLPRSDDTMQAGLLG
jgi:hypothetical protein